MPQQPTPPAKLTPEQKTNWNKFIDFVNTQKMAGSLLLDQRNKQVGMGLLQKFNFANPQNALDLGIVPKVQQELQDYRANIVNQWKSNPQTIPDAKSENEIMPNLSPVDGWPGSKTLSKKFPTAQMTIQTPQGSTVQNYGTDTDKFDNTYFPKKTN